MGQSVRERSKETSEKGADSAREHPDSEHEDKNAGEYGQEAEGVGRRVNNDFSEAMHRALRGRLG
jgi:hypothetical protein